MSMREDSGESPNGRANTTATSGAPGTPDRRAGHHRVHFEALVAVGEAKGSGFEAESIDVSPEGMRLRTAYLPQIGDRLVCRFEGDAGEVVADGEVIWRREAPRGGEFGLRFVGFDNPDAEATLRSLCQELGGSVEGTSGLGPMGIPGTRVRLHIDGLGSPMKARVREAAGGEVLVGSNLEFLKVGRSLELEDMDHGDKRAAMVDAVKVEVDPATKVPQLVVSLRFGEAKESKKAVASAKEPEKAAATKAPEKETSKEASSLGLGALIKRTTPGVGPAPVGKTEVSAGNEPKESKESKEKEARAELLSSPAVPSRARTQEMRSKPPATRPSASTEAASLRTGDEEENDEAAEANDPSLDSPAIGGSKKDFSAALRGATEKAKGATKAAFSAIGPAASGIGERAKGAMSGLFAAIRKRRGEETAEATEGQAARRTTAAPPTGALRAAGKKLVRDKEETETTEAAPKARSSRKAALMGSALGLAAVLVVVGGIRLLGASRAAPSDPQGMEANAAGSAAALPAPTAANVAPAGDPNVVPNVNVPLFGATPLSTTEPVPAMPTQPDGTIAQTPPAAPEGDAAQAGAAADEGDGEGDSEAAETQGNGKQFGKGNVRSPIVLKLKMDGDIETVNGAAGAMGFTVSLPGRRALSSATELARKDKRIASVNVVNNPAGAEISLQFKDGVPAYVAKAKGDRLVIALGTDAKKTVAKAGDKKKKGALKKKVADKKKPKKP
ncbi:PilZ domain-containing protein [Polyangium sp. y55x31]|uniref:PilZ domain-containing protein n=1 Tax=Polyangium sp. y55x31 TaxID=3042688 RepID=UPI00248263FC|nr:PilZ domain-containing protein [Polyangium sp. y55x31]MDI1484407.1 PilZ domain-containing protein [Polyangium sp. y55x31]